MPFTFFVFGTKAIEQSGVALAGFVEHAGVNCGCQKVVCGCDRVDVACQMQIEIFHRNHLRITATGCAAFDSKGGTLGWLANTSDNAASQMRTQRLAQTDGCRGFAFAERGGGNCGDVDVFTIGNVF